MADPIRKIVVRVHVGGDRMAGTDDPVFLGLRGASGREFRLGLAKGKALRRKGEEEYVFGPAGDAETNVAHAELNDPTRPPLDVDTVTGVYLRKRQEPIPNVRGIGELDDRVQLESVEVELVGEARTHRWRRDGPFWLGLACGLSFDLAPADEG